jgi:hypothetical protein
MIDRLRKRQVAFVFDIAAIGHSLRLPPRLPRNISASLLALLSGPPCTVGIDMRSQTAVI